MHKYLALIVILLLTACADRDGQGEFSFNRIDPETLNQHPYYSQVTTVSGDAKYIYIAGQTDRAVDYQVGSNACRHDDWRGQVIGVRENLENALSAAGADWDDVVFIRRFVVDMAAYRKVLASGDNPLAKQWSRRPPPSTLIEISKLSEPCQLLEVDVFAAVGQAG